MTKLPVWFYSHPRQCRGNKPALREGHSPRKDGWTLPGAAGARSPRARPPGCWGLLLQGGSGPRLPVQAGPAAQPGPNLPELRISHQYSCGAAQRQPSGLCSAGCPPVPAWFLFCSTGFPVLDWIPQRDLAQKSDDKAANGSEPHGARAAQGHLGELRFWFRSRKNGLDSCFVFVFSRVWILPPFSCLRCRCRPQKQSPHWTRDRSARFVRETF